MCCSFCIFKNLHSGHTIINISDIESLDKINIIKKSEIQEFEEISKKTEILKNKIEEEINKINTLYDKTISSLTTSFLQKHEQLLKQENDLKEKLNNEVTKIKEQLEKYLAEINNEIRISEKIKKGLKKIDKEEKNMIKNMTYISKINKSKKDMKKYFIQLMKNINFIYEEDKTNIKYEEYYFNGIYIPKNIVYKDIGISNIDIYWNIDSINIINIDKNKIKYKI